MGTPTADMSNCIQDIPAVIFEYNICRNMKGNPTPPHCDTKFRYRQGRDSMRMF